MTRAKEELFLLHASRRLIFGQIQHNAPSRFLSDIDSEYTSHAAGVVDETEITTFAAVESQAPPPDIEVQIGDKVRHKVFGVGTVDFCWPLAIAILTDCPGCDVDVVSTPIGELAA